MLEGEEKENAMPNIAPNDRVALDPLIEDLRNEVRSVVTSTHDPFDGYMRHIAERVLTEKLLDALVVNSAGIVLAIAFELCDRVLCKIDPDAYETLTIDCMRMQPVPQNALLLNARIDALIAKITELAGPPGHNDAGPYSPLFL